MPPFSTIPSLRDTGLICPGSCSGCAGNEYGDHRCPAIFIDQDWDGLPHSEPPKLWGFKTSGSRYKVGGDQDGDPLVELAEDLEEEFRASGGQGHEAQLVDDEQLEAGQLSLAVEQSSLIPGPAVRFTSFSPARRPSAVPRRGSPASEAARAYCGDMTTWSVAGGTSPRASLSM